MVAEGDGDDGDVRGSRGLDTGEDHCKMKGQWGKNLSTVFGQQPIGK